ncbi:hypothetical protein ACLOJK_015264 [Asimina triloba]
MGAEAAVAGDVRWWQWVTSSSTAVGTDDGRPGSNDRGRWMGGMAVERTSQWQRAAAADVSSEGVVSWRWTAVAGGSRRRQWMAWISRSRPYRR